MSDFNFDDYPDTKEAQFNFDDYPDTKEMGFGEGLARASINAIPVATGIAGGFVGSALGPLGTVGGAGLGAAGGKSLENILERYLFDDEKSKQDAEMTGKSSPEQLLQSFKEPAIAGAEGLTAEMGGQILSKAAPMAWKAVGGEKAASSLRSVGNSVGEYLAPQAEKLAVNSTGATGAQSAKFADDAGRELLDRKLVRFGDNAENIAKRTGDAMDLANAEIDSALKSLDARGVTASADNVVAELEKRMAALSKDASQAGAVKKLQSIVEDITATGESNIPISMGEKTKRGFNKMAGNWMDPEKGQAGKTAYQAYRKEVEEAAQTAAPDLADKFTQAKKTYGLLAPIEEAAVKRANTLNQSPFGGLLDVATVGSGGAAVGGPVGLATGVAAAAGRKVLAPRVTSSAAVTIDKISKALMSSPQIAQLSKTNPGAFQTMVSRMGQTMSQNSQAPASMMKAAEAPDNSVEAPQPQQDDKEQIIKKTEGSKYSQVLQNAAQKGDASFNAAHYILSQRDPEYRKQLGQSE